MWKGLGEDVGGHLVSGAPGEFHHSAVYGVTYVVVVDVDMFRAGMVFWIVYKSDSSLIIQKELTRLILFKSNTIKEVS